jgi:ClpX C4-type zinc finger
MMRLRSLRCSFCRRKEDDVAKLVAGRRGYICDRCVASAAEIMAAHSGDVPPRSRQHAGVIPRLRALFRRTARRPPSRGSEYSAAV